MFDLFALYTAADAVSSVWSQSDDEEPSAAAWLPSGANSQASADFSAESQASAGLTPEQAPGSQAQQEAERDALLQRMQVPCPLMLTFLCRCAGTFLNSVVPCSLHTNPADSCGEAVCMPQPTAGLAAI